MKSSRKLSAGMFAAALAVGLVVGTALPASAASSSGWQTCAGNQQYGIQTRLSAVNSSSTTRTTHTYVGAYSVDYYGQGYKNSSRAGVSSGGWEAYVPSPASFLNANGTCGPKVS